MASDFVDYIEKTHFVGMKFILRYLDYPEIYEEIFHRAGVTLDLVKRINNLWEKDQRGAYLMTFKAIENINDVID